MINGLGFAVILGAAVSFWFQRSDLGVVIGLAMICVLTAAAFGGIVIPVTVENLGIDPAVSSGPFVTTVTESWFLPFWASPRSGSG